MNELALKGERNASVDVMRIAAFFLVVCLHFTYASDYVDLVVGGKKLYVMYVIRAITVCCVPLFIMLTGYLQTNKRVCARYYLGILRPLAIYVISGLVCLWYKVIFYDYSADPIKLFFRLANFSASDYGWYMEMYFGLFLMIPFLNAAYHGMKSQKQKLVLIGSFILLTALPGVLNTFNFSSLEWWALPSQGKSYDELIPAWWTGIYPVTYYFIGSYLREYPLRLKKSVNVLLIAASALLVGTYNFYRLRGGEFFYGAFLTNASLLVLIIAVLIFALFVERDMRAIPLWMKKSLSVISGWTLAAYLVSSIFDVRIYRILKDAVPVIEDRVYYAPLTVTAVFILSLFSGGVIDCVYRLGDAAVRRMIRYFRKKRT